MTSSFVALLGNLPPDATAYLMAVTPGVLLLLVGFTIRHAMDVASAKAWSR